MYFAEVLQNRFIKPLRNLHLRTDGSASVEFVLLAIPLFLPILVFLNHFSTLSNSELIARTLVRESLRAYITSPNMASASAENLTEEQIRNLKLDFECSESPCIKPKGRIRATLTMELPKESKVITVQAEEYVSAWQWDENGHGIQPSLKVDPTVILDFAVDKFLSILGVEPPLSK
jgi:high-affinity K+ transport system ATPase subunit B